MSVTFGGRTADHDIDPQFLERWSPRAFTAEPIPEPTLMSMFEAARWAPSAFNGQPWRFVYARREKAADWDPLFGACWIGMDNPDLGRRPGALGAWRYIASDKFRRRDGQEPQPHPTHVFDAGAAWGYLALQAHNLGWAAHGMAGFDHAKAHAATGLPEDAFHISAAIAIGRPTDPGVLPEDLPRPRKSRAGRMPVSGVRVSRGRYRPAWAGGVGAGQEVHLAQRHALAAQDRVGRSDVEQEVREREAEQEVLAGELHGPAGEGERDRAVFSWPCTLLSRFNAFDEGHGLGDPLLLSWAQLVSLSGIEGASTPARRAAPLLAASLANCTWRVKLAMP